LDRPNRGEESEEAIAGEELLANSARVVLRFGCTGGERSIVGCVSKGECEHQRELGVTRLALATCSNKHVNVTDMGGLTCLRGGSTRIIDPVPIVLEGCQWAAAPLNIDLSRQACYNNIPHSQPHKANNEACGRM
jgi:hypothetical protein